MFSSGFQAFANLCYSDLLLGEQVRHLLSIGAGWSHLFDLLDLCVIFARGDLRIGLDLLIVLQQSDDLKFKMNSTLLISATVLCLVFPRLFVRIENKSFSSIHSVIFFHLLIFHCDQNELLVLVEEKRKIRFTFTRLLYSVSSIFHLYPVTQRMNTNIQPVIKAPPLLWHILTMKSGGDDYHLVVQHHVQQTLIHAYWKVCLNWSDH